MTNLRLFIGLFVVATGGLIWSAQSQAAGQGLTIGVDYGMTEAFQMSGNSTDATQNYEAYGALMDVPLGANIGLMTGVLYSELGGHQKYTGYDFDVKLPYYQIPALVEWKPFGIFGLGIGAYYGIPAGDAVETGTIANTASASTTDTFGNLGWRGSDYGLAANLRVKIPLSVLYVAADALYEYGLENVYAASGQSANNRALLLMASIGFQF